MKFVSSSKSANQVNIEDKLTPALPFTVVKQNFYDNEVQLYIEGGQVIVSWNTSKTFTTIRLKMTLMWRGLLFQLDVQETFEKRSNTIVANVVYKGESYRFGIGRSSIGIGAIGTKPEISSEDFKLSFTFGKNLISIDERLRKDLPI